MAIIMSMMKQISVRQFVRQNKSKISLVACVFCPLFVQAQRLEFADEYIGISGLNGVTSLVATPNGETVYSAGYVDDRLSVFSRDTTTGSLTLRHVIDFNAESVIELAVSPDGANLYSVNAGSDAIVAYTITPSGFLTRLGWVSTLNNPTSLDISPDGRHVYVAQRLGDAIRRLDRDSQGVIRKKADYVNGQQGFQGLSGLRCVRVSRDGQFVYAATEFDSSFVVLKRDDVKGDLTPWAVFYDGQDGVDFLSFGSYVEESVNGRFIYVAARNDNAISVFKRGLSSSVFSYVGAYVDGVSSLTGLKNVRTLAMNPSGDWLLSTSLDDDTVNVFSIDIGTGLLSLTGQAVNGVGGVAGLSEPASALTMPDNTVYVSGFADGTVNQFLFNGTSLDYQWSIWDGTGSAVEKPRNLNYSHGSLYVAGPAKDSWNNKLTHYESLPDRTLQYVRDYDYSNQFGVTSITTPTGEWLYTAGYGGIDTYARDLDTGVLTHVDLVNEFGTVVGMGHEGRFLFIRHDFEDLTVYSISPAIGVLTEIQRINYSSTIKAVTHPTEERLYVQVDDTLRTLGYDEATGMMEELAWFQNQASDRPLIDPFGSRLITTYRQTNSSILRIHDIDPNSLRAVPVYDFDLAAFFGPDHDVRPVCFSPDGSLLLLSVASSGQPHLAIAMFGIDVQTNELELISIYDDDSSGYSWLTRIESPIFTPNRELLLGTDSSLMRLHYLPKLDVLVDQFDGIQVAEGTNNDMFAVQLGHQPNLNVRIPFLTHPDLTIEPDALTFSPLDWDQPQLITVSAIDDDIARGNRKLFITPSPLQSNDSSFNGTRLDRIPVTVTDNDIQRKELPDVGADGTIFANNQTGFLHPSAEAFFQKSSYAAADLDMDWDIDLVTRDGSGFTWDTFIEIHENQGASSFVHKQTISWPSSSGANLLLGDLDNDDDIDLIVVGTTGRGLEGFLNNGSGTFGPSFFFDIRYGPYSKLIDMNKDGQLDLFLSTRYDSYIYFNDGGSFLPEVELPDISTRHILDLNRDGIFDLVAINDGDRTIDFYLGGSSGYSINQSFEFPNYPVDRFVFDSGDIDQDGTIDVVAAYAGLHIFRNTGLGIVHSGFDQLGVGFQQGILLVDIDGDNDLDIVLQDPNRCLENRHGLFYESGMYLSTGQLEKGLVAAPLIARNCLLPVDFRSDLDHWSIDTNILELIKKVERLCTRIPKWYE